MMQSLGAVTELLAWIGLGVGSLAALVWGFGRLIRSAWVETDAVIVQLPDGPILRWLGDDGAVNQRPLEHWEQTELADADHCKVVARHDRARLASAPPPERTFGVLAIAFLGVGAASLVVQLVLMLVI